MSDARRLRSATPGRARVHLRAGPCSLVVEGASDRDLDAIAGQLGAVPGDPVARPDLVVEVGPVEGGTRRLLGAGDYAFDDERFLVLRGPAKRPIELEIPFDRLGASPRLRCAPGSAPLPLLVALVNLAALEHGIVGAHSSAFDLDGLGVLVTGWAKGGKTETLLAFAGQGARYVGDEWVHLWPDGTLTGLPEPMRLWGWHLEQLGDRGPQLSTSSRLSLSVLGALTAGGSTLDGRLPGSLRRLRHLLARQRNVRVPPASWLPTLARTHLDVLVVTESHTAPTITVQQVPSAFAAERMATMSPVERGELETAYAAFRYAFPDRRSAALDGAAERERQLLRDRLAGVPTLLVRHPYPFDLEAMARTLRPYLDAHRHDAAGAGQARPLAL